MRFSAVIGKNVRIAENCSLGACKIGNSAIVGRGCVVEDGAEIGESSRLGAGCVIGRDAKVGAGARLSDGVIVEERARVKPRTSLRAGSIQKCTSAS